MDLKSIYLILRNFSNTSKDVAKLRLSSGPLLALFHRWHFPKRSQMPNLHDNFKER